MTKLRKVKVASITFWLGIALNRSALATDSQTPLTSIDAVFAGASRESDVAIVGIVAQYQNTTSAAGKNYQVFQLCQDRCLTVFVAERTRLNDGDAVRVTGRFKPRVTAGSHTFFNEIIADSVEPYAASSDR